MEKNCEDMGPLLSAYLDGEGTEAERLGVERHLEGCKNCQRFARELDLTGRIIKETLSGTAETEVDLTGVWEEIKARVDFGPTIWLKLKLWIERPVVWLPAAVATATIVLFLLMLPIQSHKSLTALNKVESVYSRTGQVMILQTGKTGQPLIWILPEKKRVG